MAGGLADMGLWRGRHARSQSLSAGIGNRGRKIPAQSLALQNLFPAGIGVANRDRFDARLRLVRVWRPVPGAAIARSVAPSSSAPASEVTNPPHHPAIECRFHIATFRGSKIK